MKEITELFKKTAGDSNLLSKFNLIQKEAEKEAPAETERKLIAFAKEAGYEITGEDLRNYLLKSADDKQLSDLELDLVAGGKTWIGGLYQLASVISLTIACEIISAKADQENGEGACEQLPNN